MRSEPILLNVDYARRERGSILVSFALLLIVMLGFIGLGVEVGRWYILRAELSKSVDAAALAAAKNISNPNVNPEILASEFCDQNFPVGGFGTPGSGTGTAQFNTRMVGTDRVSVDGHVSASAMFTRLFGFDLIPISSAGMAQQRPVEIMLVLDRSGSMGGQPIADLKDAAKSFLDYFKDTQDKDKIGLISFATTAYVDRTPGIYFIAPLKAIINGFEARNQTNSEDAIDQVDGPNGLSDQSIVPEDERIQQFVIFFSDGVPTAQRSFFKTDNQIIDAVVTVNGQGGATDGVYDELYDPLSRDKVAIAGRARALPTGNGISPANGCKAVTDAGFSVRWNILDTHPFSGYVPDACGLPSGSGSALGAHLSLLNRTLAIENAQDLKDKRITIFTIGLGDVDRDFLGKIASGPDLAFYTPTSAELDVLFQKVAQSIRLRLVQ
jgi:Flp pilus assembly protein TadG/uncharacterized protein YegL